MQPRSAINTGGTGRMGTSAKYQLLIASFLLSATTMTGDAQDRPRIMPAPRADMPPTYADQVYRTSGELELRADVYMPKSDEATAVIAWFAGGGFRIRDKLMIRGSIMRQVDRGIALAEPGADNKNVPDRVSGVVSFYGPTDLTTTVGWPEDRSIVPFLTGCESGDCRSIAGSASPVYYVSAASPPALMFYGMGDVVIGYEQGLLLQERLDAAGVDAQLVLRSGLIHGDERFDEPAMGDLITAFVSRGR